MVDPESAVQEPAPVPGTGGETAAHAAVPDLVQALLKVLGGIAGGAALFGAIASFAGRQYNEAYFKEAGIPYSALSFSTQDYLFAGGVITLLGFSAVIGMAAGIAVGLTFSLDDLTGLIRSIYRPYRAAFGIRGPRLTILWRAAKQFRPWDALLLVGLIATLVYLANVGFQHDPGFLRRGIRGELLVMGFGFFTFLLSAISLLLITEEPGHTETSNQSAGQTTTSKDRQQLLLLAPIVPAMILATLLVFGPAQLGRLDAAYDANHPNSEAIGVEIVVNVSSPQIPSSATGDRCSGFNVSEQGGYCQLNNMVVIIHNNGHYFVSPYACGGANGQRKTLSIPDSQVVSLSYSAPIDSTRCPP